MSGVKSLGYECPGKGCILGRGIVPRWLLFSDSNNNSQYQVSLWPICQAGGLDLVGIIAFP